MKRLLKPVVHFGSLIPLALLINDWMSDSLTANPIQYLTLKTGKTALILITMSLAVSPIIFITGKNYLSPLRKLLGLYSALYAALHFSIFVGLDYFFDWELISGVIIEKPYVLAGFSAFLILSVMAITSTKGWKRRLKKKWKPLHRFVYAAGFLVVLHYVWLVKSDIREPLAYGFVIGLLLTLRIPRIRVLVSACKEKRVSLQESGSQP